MTRLKALVVDADDPHNTLLGQNVSDAGFEVSVCTSLAQAAEYLAEHRPDLVFVALDFNGEDGLELLDQPNISASSELILMNETDDPTRVSYGISKGATYFACKPLDQPFLSLLLGDLVDEISAEAPRAADTEEPCPLDQFGDLRGSSAVMRKVFRTLRKVAPAETSVLLIGESGTGKDLAATTIHQFSPRCEQPYVPLNCGAVPKDLFESELFGHEKGSFSGASRQHRGVFERAAGGTLFLDEVTEMTQEHQVKLLRVLETNTFRRVGGERDLTSDVRIITATNRDPDEAIEEGLLREDLYYRIARFPIYLPPLRGRGTDIVGLAQLFLTSLNDEQQTTKAFSPEALEALSSYTFPGNVRELQSIVERAFLLAGPVILAADLPALDAERIVETDLVKVPVGSSIDEAERRLILATLEAHDGDKPGAAKTLGISLKTLYNRLNEYASAEREAN